jgi:hypothetical protein
MGGVAIKAKRRAPSFLPLLAKRPLKARGLAPAPLDNQAPGFDFSDLRVFTSIPPYHYDVVAMRGLVAVYDRECLGREGIQMGKLYVRENQLPPSMMQWEEWLKREWADREGRHKPFSRLTVRREVVLAFTHPRHGGPCLRLDSGFVDGPYHEWAFGHCRQGRRPRTSLALSQRFSEAPWWLDLYRQAFPRS